MTIFDLLALFGDRFQGDTWRPWRCVLAVIFGLPPEDSAIARRLLGRDRLPDGEAQEIWILAGRRGGKSQAAALIAIFLAAFRTYRLSPGEVGTVMVIAADRRQARVILRYCKGLLLEVPKLAALIVGETAESLTLSNGICIEITTSSIKSVRGYSVVACLADEIAYWRTDDGSANPDREVLAAIRPSLMTTGGKLIAISTGYARRGSLFAAFREHYGKDGDPILYFKASTRDLNPSVPQSEIDKAMEADESAARAELMGEFRTDIEGFVSRDVVEAGVVPGRHELPPMAGVVYTAFVDPSGGAQDHFTLAIGHREGDVIVHDVSRARVPPFSPSDVVTEYAALLKSYRISRVVGDRYAGEFPRELFRKHGITYEASAKPKSDIYRECLPLLNAGRIQILDVPKLTAQLVGLERRTARSGKDSIDHCPGGRDDVANSFCGVATLLTTFAGARLSVRRL